jgi:hypothetical protein
MEFKVPHSSAAAASHWCSSSGSSLLAHDGVSVLLVWSFARSLSIDYVEKTLILRC